MLRNSTLPGLFEQLDNLILWLGQKQPGYGGKVEIVEEVLAYVGSAADSDLGFICDYALEAGLIKGDRVRTMRDFPNGPFQLSFKGWERFAQLQRGASAARQAFMAMKFGDPVTDSLFKECFKPAVSATGFELKRLDEEPRAGLIDDRLRVEIRQSRFLIADLTHHNNGAYWEAGFAEGLGKPVIYTCNKRVFEDKTNGGTHFDTNHHLTVTWDPDNLGEAVELLKATIRATLPAEAKQDD